MFFFPSNLYFWIVLVTISFFPWQKTKKWQTSHFFCERNVRDFFIGEEISKGMLHKKWSFTVGKVFFWRYSNWEGRTFALCFCLLLVHSNLSFVLWKGGKSISAKTTSIYTSLYSYQTCWFWFFELDSLIPAAIRRVGEILCRWWLILMVCLVLLQPNWEKNKTCTFRRPEIE